MGSGTFCSRANSPPFRANTESKSHHQSKSQMSALKVSTYLFRQQEFLFPCGVCSVINSHMCASVRVLQLCSLLVYLPTQEPCIAQKCTTFFKQHQPPFILRRHKPVEVLEAIAPPVSSDEVRTWACMFTGGKGGILAADLIAPAELIDQYVLLALCTCL